MHRYMTLRPDAASSYTTLSAAGDAVSMAHVPKTRAQGAWVAALSNAKIPHLAGIKDVFEHEGRLAVAAEVVDPEGGEAAAAACKRARGSGGFHEGEVWGMLLQGVAALAGLRRLAGDVNALLASGGALTADEAPIDGTHGNAGAFAIDGDWIAAAAPAASAVDGEGDAAAAAAGSGLVSIVLPLPALTGGPRPRGGSAAVDDDGEKSDIHAFATQLKKIVEGACGSGGGLQGALHPGTSSQYSIDLCFLMMKMTEAAPRERPTLAQILQHPPVALRIHVLLAAPNTAPAAAAAREDRYRGLLAVLTAPAAPAPPATTPSIPRPAPVDGGVPSYAAAPASSPPRRPLQPLNHHPPSDFGGAAKRADTRGGAACPRGGVVSEVRHLRVHFDDDEPERDERLGDGRDRVGAASCGACAEHARAVDVLKQKLEDALEYGEKQAHQAEYAGRELKRVKAAAHGELDALRAQLIQAREEIAFHRSNEAALIEREARVNTFLHLYNVTAEQLQRVPTSLGNPQTQLFKDYYAIRAEAEAGASGAQEPRASGVAVPDNAATPTPPAVAAATAPPTPACPSVPKAAAADHHAQFSFVSSITHGSDGDSGSKAGDTGVGMWGFSDLPDASGEGNGEGEGGREEVAAADDPLVRPAAATPTSQAAQVEAPAIAQPAWAAPSPPTGAAEAMIRDEDSGIAAYSAGARAASDVVYREEDSDQNPSPSLALPSVTDPTAPAVTSVATAAVVPVTGSDDRGVALPQPIVINAGGATEMDVRVGAKQIDDHPAANLPVARPLAFETDDVEEALDGDARRQQTRAAACVEHSGTSRTMDTTVETTWASGVVSPALVPAASPHAAAAAVAAAANDLTVTSLSPSLTPGGGGAVRSSTTTAGVPSPRAPQSTAADTSSATATTLRNEAEWAVYAAARRRGRRSSGGGQGVLSATFGSGASDSMLAVSATTTPSAPATVSVSAWSSVRHGGGGGGTGTPGTPGESGSPQRHTDARKGALAAKLGKSIATPGSGSTRSAGRRKKRVTVVYGADLSPFRSPAAGVPTTPQQPPARSPSTAATSTVGASSTGKKRVSILEGEAPASPSPGRRSGAGTLPGVSASPLKSALKTPTRGPAGADAEGAHTGSSRRRTAAAAAPPPPPPPSHGTIEAQLAEWGLSTSAGTASDIDAALSAGRSPRDLSSAGLPAVATHRVVTEAAPPPAHLSGLTTTTPAASTASILEDSALPAAAAPTPSESRSYTDASMASPASAGVGWGRGRPQGAADAEGVPGGHANASSTSAGVVEESIMAAGEAGAGGVAAAETAVAPGAPSFVEEDDSLAQVVGALAANVIGNISVSVSPMRSGSISLAGGNACDGTSISTDPDRSAFSRVEARSPAASPEVRRKNVREPNSSARRDGTPRTATTPDGPGMRHLHASRDYYGGGIDGDGDGGAAGDNSVREEGEECIFPRAAAAAVAGTYARSPGSGSNAEGHSHHHHYPAIANLPILDEEWSEVHHSTPQLWDVPSPVYTSPYSATRDGPEAAGGVEDGHGGYDMPPSAHIHAVHAPLAPQRLHYVDEDDDGAPPSVYAVHTAVGYGSGGGGGADEAAAAMQAPPPPPGSATDSTATTVETQAGWSPRAAGGGSGEEAAAASSPPPPPPPEDDEWLVARSHPTHPHLARPSPSLATQRVRAAVETPPRSPRVVPATAAAAAAAPVSSQTPPRRTHEDMIAWHLTRSPERYTHALDQDGCAAGRATPPDLGSAGVHTNTTPLQQCRILASGAVLKPWQQSREAKESLDAHRAVLEDMSMRNRARADARARRRGQRGQHASASTTPHTGTTTGGTQATPWGDQGDADADTAARAAAAVSASVISATQRVLGLTIDEDSSALQLQAVDASGATTMTTTTARGRGPALDNTACSSPARYPQPQQHPTHHTPSSADATRTSVGASTGVRATPSTVASSVWGGGAGEVAATEGNSYSSVNDASQVGSRAGTAPHGADASDEESPQALLARLRAERRSMKRMTSTA